MATALVEPVTVQDVKSGLEKLTVTDALEGKREVVGHSEGKALRFAEQPWADTHKVKVLTGAERDESIANNIAELIGM